VGPQKNLFFLEPPPRGRPLFFEKGTPGVQPRGQTRGQKGGGGLHPPPKPGVNPGGLRGPPQIGGRWPPEKTPGVWGRGFKIPPQQLGLINPPPPGFLKTPLKIFPRGGKKKSLPPCPFPNNLKAPKRPHRNQGTKRGMPLLNPLIPRGKSLRKTWWVNQGT